MHIRQEQKLAVWQKGQQPLIIRDSSLLLKLYQCFVTFSANRLKRLMLPESMARSLAVLIRLCKIHRNNVDIVIAQNVTAGALLFMLVQNQVN